MDDTISVTRKILIPRFPNYILFADGGKLDIADISDDDLRTIGEAWTRGLIEQAKARREQKKV